MKDDALLCTAGDEIDNAVFRAIFALSPPQSGLEWDKSLIGEATDAIKSVMERHGLKSVTHGKTKTKQSVTAPEITAVIAPGVNKKGARNECCIYQ